MKWIARSCVSLAMIAVAAPTELSAQTDNKLAVGLGVSTILSADPGTRGTTNLGFFHRLGRGREGWGWKYGLNWYSAELERQLEGASQDFGHLRIRPLLGGYGYTHIKGRTNVSTSLMGGYAFTSFRRRSTYDAALRANRDVVGEIDSSSSNTFVLRPEASLWYDINKKLGLNVNGGYIIARPEVTVTSSIGQDRQRIRADMFTLRAGLVYSLF